MVSKQLNEGAARLADQSILRLLIQGQALEPAVPGNEAAEPVNWPLERACEIGLDVDAETLNWFRANYAEWQQKIGFVLRMWALAQMGSNSMPSDGPDPLP